MAGDIRNRRHGPNCQGLLGFPDAPQFRYPAQVHYALGTNNAFFYLSQKIGAAGDKPILTGAPGAQLDRFVYRFRSYMFKWLQYSNLNQNYS